jgi:hypothetical protein
MTLPIAIFILSEEEVCEKSSSSSSSSIKTERVSLGCGRVVE